MIFYWAERFHTLPSEVKKIPFMELCDEYDELLLNDERNEMVQERTTKVQDGKVRVPVYG